MKKKIAVVFGGRSTEHEVSRVSAYSIINNLDKDLYEIVQIGVTQQGDWLPYYGPADKLPDGSWEDIARQDAGLADCNDRKNCKPELARGIAELEKCDCILPVLHGQNGEDGTVQGLFELLDIPYVGCNVLSSAVCMDKVYTKIVLDRAGIPQCDYIVAHRHHILEDEHAYEDEVAAKLGYPCFIKPSNSGSSVGCIKVKTPEELHEALMLAQQYDRKILIEKYVVAREIECAILGNINPKAAQPGEIKPSAEFYDYEDKYVNGSSICVIPANIPDHIAEKIKEYAKAAFTACDCSGLSRIDFFLSRDENGEENVLMLNEINTLPGFTDISMYGKLWANEGIPFTELLNSLIDLAFERKQQNARRTSK
ncbi:MAG: D-alanine--D-alanine ligase [Ruminococcaceae bacterium]|nr:D-alanine--D-alanine ligase [Oscillospiraceae bacterium]